MNSEGNPGGLTCGSGSAPQWIQKFPGRFSPSGHFKPPRRHRFVGDGSSTAFFAASPGVGFDGDTIDRGSDSVHRHRFLYLSRCAPGSFATAPGVRLTRRAEGDRVVLHTKQPQLSKPLIRGGKTNLRRGHLEHNHIIGSRVWDPVQAHKGQNNCGPERSTLSGMTDFLTGPELRLSLPTLEEYVALTPRHVTPVRAPPP